MILSPTAKATLLLTSHFSKVGSKEAKPLTNAEWGRFALWLKKQSTTPADLLVTEPKALLDSCHDARISTDRIVQLLNRGHSLALAVERWQRTGLWVVTRSDPEYPRRLKQRLKTDSPPVIFGSGNKELLNSGGLAVIGSRNASEADLTFTGQVGAKAATEDVVIISGGARGVDEASMLGALHQGGVVIGVMADSLLKAATSAKWRQGLMEGHLVLISPFYPDAGFNTGNAMARNKYIYCLADSSLVIHSGKKGGTLNGAKENLKKNWVPLWVKRTADVHTANADLVAEGGRWCGSDIQSLKIADLFETEGAVASQVKQEQIDLFSVPAKPALFLESESDLKSQVAKTEETATRTDKQAENTAASESVAKAQESLSSSVDFYQLFLSELRQLAKTPSTVEVLLENTGLQRSQLNVWLKRATDENVVTKLSRPVRYQVKGKK